MLLPVVDQLPQIGISDCCDGAAALTRGDIGPGRRNCAEALSLFHLYRPGAPRSAQISLQLTF